MSPEKDDRKTREEKLRQYLVLSESIRRRILKDAELRKLKNQNLSVATREEQSTKISNRFELSKLVEYNSRISHIPSEELCIHYLPDLLVAERCIGARLARSIHSGEMNQPSVQDHTEISLYVALRAIEHLNYNSSKRHDWTGPPRDINGNTAGTDDDTFWRIEWLRTMFRCALVLPIGFLVSHTELRATSVGAPSWSPCFEDMPDYEAKHGTPTVRKAPNRVLSAASIAFSTYLRIYGPANGEIPMLSLAEADFFSDRPNRDNPLAEAMHVTIHHIFHDRIATRLPFWWTMLINHHFSRDRDFRPIPCVLKGVPSEGFRRVDDDEPQSDATSAEKDVETVPAAEAASSNSLEEAKTSPLLRTIVEMIRVEIQSGEFKANTGGAVFQVYDNRVHLVVPAIWKRLASRLKGPAVDEDEIFQEFFKAGLLAIKSVDAAETVFEIRPPNANKRLGKVRSIPLSAKGELLLFPSGSSLTNNPDLRPILAQQNADAA